MTTRRLRIEKTSNHRVAITGDLYAAFDGQRALPCSYWDLAQTTSLLTVPNQHDEIFKTCRRTNLDVQPIFDRLGTAEIKTRRRVNATFPPPH